jgi:nicotinamidase-related amidase
MDIKLRFTISTEEADGFAQNLLHTTNSLFAGLPTVQAIEQSGRRVLIVAGFMMEAVVLDTVLDARAAGYEVLVAVDACGSPSLRTEQAVIESLPHLFRLHQACGDEGVAMLA